MTARASDAPGLSVPVHRCHGAANNGTCAEQLSLFPPFSSTLALLVLVAVLVGIILVSLATFHFHKRKLRNRKIQRAQEEYERDSRSPARAGEPARPCIIVRPVRGEAERGEQRAGGEVERGEQRAGGEAVEKQREESNEQEEREEKWKEENNKQEKEEKVPTDC